MYLRPEEKTVGQENFSTAIGVNRRDFLKAGIAAGAVSGAGLGAMYFGYGASVGNPLRVGGDRHRRRRQRALGEPLTPSFLQVVAIADIRPLQRPPRVSRRPLERKRLARPAAGDDQVWLEERQTRPANTSRSTTNDYHDLLKDPDVEAVVIGPAAAPARARRRRGHGRRQARADREADGPQCPRVQRDGPLCQAAIEVAGHRAPAALQHFV